jgi:hypothetical protein
VSDKRIPDDIEFPGLNKNWKIAINQKKDRRAVVEISSPFETHPFPPKLRA